MNLLHYRTIKSYVLRQGRLSERQKAGLLIAWNDYGLDPTQANYDWQQLFGNTNHVILEIGFGMGASLLQMASTYPEINFIGIEVHKPGVGALLADLTQQQLTNVRVFCADAVTVLSHCIANESLNGIHIFFPDPWPKRRHHKRRLIQSDLVTLLTQKLKPGGLLHLATDWQDYAMQMLQVLSGINNLQNTAANGQFSSNRADRPPTKYEQRGQRLGHEVWDLIFMRTVFPSSHKPAKRESSTQ